MKMTKFAGALLSALIALIFTACGGNQAFKVKGKIDGFSTQNLHIVYNDGAQLKAVTIAAIDSKFEFEGNSPEGTVVEIFNNQRLPIGIFFAKNGEEIEVELKATDRNYLKAKGDETSTKLADFLAQNSDDLNGAIARMVSKNPDSLLSAILLGYCYDPSKDPDEAWELYNLIDYTGMPQSVNAGVKEMMARYTEANTVGEMRLLCAGDSMMTFSPADKGVTLYCFDSRSLLPDSIKNQFDSIPSTNVSIAFLRMRPDTLTWGRSTSRLPERVVSLWAPAGAAEPCVANLNIVDIPYYIVADKEGKQLYRGNDFDAASSTIAKSIGNK